MITKQCIQELSTDRVACYVPMDVKMDAFTKGILLGSVNTFVVLFFAIIIYSYIKKIKKS